MSNTGGKGNPAGLTGATGATRYVGATTDLPPTTGTFAVGDFVVSASGVVYVCTVAGTPGTWRSPDNAATAANLYANINAKGWASPPDACQSTFLMVAATIYLCKIPIPYTTTITNIIFNIVTTPAAAQSNSQVGLYDSTGVLLSSSADLGTTWQSTGTKTNALAVAQAITGGPTVFVYAALHQGAGTPPTIQASGALASAAQASFGMTAATTRFGTQTGHATNNLATIGSLTLSSTAALVRFLPVLVS